jgi:uncharacterized protein YbcC (UPF0753/DUF2309 family)
LLGRLRRRARDWVQTRPEWGWPAMPPSSPRRARGPARWTCGVFEGNGGDLRIGLARQSLHDGQRWMHRPLRLHVVIEAPRAMIDQVIAAHSVVRDLVRNGWLHLLRLDGLPARLELRTAGGWQPLPTG